MEQSRSIAEARFTSSSSSRSSSTSSDRGEGGSGLLGISLDGGSSGGGSSRGRHVVKKNSEGCENRLLPQPPSSSSFSYKGSAAGGGGCGGEGIRSTNSNFNAVQTSRNPFHQVRRVAELPRRGHILLTTQYSEANRMKCTTRSLLPSSSSNSNNNNSINNSKGEFYTHSLKFYFISPFLTLKEVELSKSTNDNHNNCKINATADLTSSLKPTANKVVMAGMNLFKWLTNGNNNCEEQQVTTTVAANNFRRNNNINNNCNGSNDNNNGGRGGGSKAPTRPQHNASSKQSGNSDKGRRQKKLDIELERLNTKIVSSSFKT